jgi:putative membrane protein
LGASAAATASSLALALAALGYGFGFWKLRETAPAALGVGRLLSFYAGLAVVWLAVASPLAALDHRLLTAHMVQHLLLLNLAAPLLLLGQPLRVLSGGVATGARQRQATGVAARLGALLTHPVVTWLSGTLVVLLFHVPAVLEATRHSALWHSVQHASFLAAGLLFFWPVVLPWPAVARWPAWAMPLYLFLATLPCDALAAFLAFSGRVVYPGYLALGSTQALADQARAAALMWFCVTVGYLVPALVLTLRLLSRPRPKA